MSGLTVSKYDFVFDCAMDLRKSAENDLSKELAELLIEVANSWSKWKLSGKDESKGEILDKLLERAYTVTSRLFDDKIEKMAQEV